MWDVLTTHHRRYAVTVALVEMFYCTVPAERQNKLFYLADCLLTAVGGCTCTINDGQVWCVSTFRRSDCCLFLYSFVFSVSLPSFPPKQAEQQAKAKAAKDAAAAAAATAAATAAAAESKASAGGAGPTSAQAAKGEVRILLLLFLLCHAEVFFCGWFCFSAITCGDVREAGLRVCLRRVNPPQEDIPGLFFSSLFLVDLSIHRTESR